jgi:mono/diheme cytochrome c family protein
MIARIAGGSLVGLAVLAGVVAVAASRSQALLDARHPKPPSQVQAAVGPAAIARGGHLVTVAACAGCHGEDLAGRMIGVAGSTVSAPNLTLRPKRMSDADLDRAIRRGLRPDGVSELAMPSFAYASFADGDVAAIVAYLRSLPPRGTVAAPPPPGVLLRVYLAAGAFKTSAAQVAEAKAPLDGGPSFEAGRRLAAVACGQCHGGDLGGGRGLPGPDLTVRGYYDRGQFRTLMRTGEGIDRDLGLMSLTARQRFSHFSDGEIDQIFDYLYARDRILAAARPAS